jgi:multimeric flavodoxin WrbA
MRLNMKVLGLTCGRKMGNSEILVREALIEVEKHGAETEIIRLGDLTIKPCTGCEGCVRNMIKGGLGDCVQKDDHFRFLLDKLTEADGIILGVPAYMLMPPGLFIMIMNRTVGAGKGFIEKVTKKPKIGALITLGGTDWVNLLLPLTNLTFNRLLRGQIKVIDHMLVTYIPRPAQVLLREEELERAREIGHEVIEALDVPYDKVKYLGRIEETCPVCHNNLLKIRGKYVECPICDIKGTIELKGRKLKVNYTDRELKKHRFGPWGTKRHDEQRIEGHDEYYANKSEIDEKIKKYRSGKGITIPPPLKQS